MEPEDSLIILVYPLPPSTITLLHHDLAEKYDLADAVRSLNIHIESTQKARSLPIKHVAHFLDQLQTTVYHIGDSIAGGDFRIRGHPQDAIIDRCELIFQDISKGSVVLDLGLQDQQTTLTGPSLGEASLNKLYEIVLQIDHSDAMQDRIREIIEDPLHRTRILNDLDRLWPEEGKGYSVTISPPKHKPVKLHPTRKFYIEELLSREGGQKGRVTVRGVLHKISSYPKDVMQIMGPDGNISIRTEDVAAAAKYFDKPIAVSGEARFDAAGNVAQLLDLKNIRPFKELPINRVFSDKIELQLSKPLVVQIGWENKKWAMKNESLNIVALDKDYADCLKEVYNQFFFVWREYGLAEDSSLTPGAKLLKKKIISLVKEQPHL